ncbi:MAG: polysaccharide biosynthesis protein [Cellulosilyticaceae bacterium]
MHTHSTIFPLLKHKIILITGGTGSWGQALASRLLKEDVAEIRILARNENLQFEFNKACNCDKVKMYIGDIRDKKSLLEACRGVDIIFHFAALKHVPICEAQPLEAIKTNVVGTQNIIDVAIMCKVKQVIYASTDKAVDPSNTYGLTKALGEKLIISANNKSLHTRFSCIRSGNILGSNGSVLPIFMKQIATHQPISITDKRMTRFFITIEEALEHFLHILTIASGGEIFILKMPSFRIQDIAEVLLEHAGLSSEMTFEIGLRPGERLGESLLCDSEKDCVYDVLGRYYMVLPPNIFHPLLSESDVHPTQIHYHSDHALISKEAVATYLHTHGFLPTSAEVGLM